MNVQPTRPRLLLADDHRMFAEGLGKLLESQVEVVGIVGDGRELLASVETERPDVIVCDISMPGLDGLQATRQLLESDPECKVVVLSMHADRSHVRGAFRAGVRGYVVKSAAADELLTAVHEVLAGRFFASPTVTQFLVDAVRVHHGDVSLSPEIPHRLLETEPRPVVETPLTPREAEISRLVARGWSNQKVADNLHLAEPTIRTHLKRIFEKLELSNRVELALYAVQVGLVDLGRGQRTSA